VVSIHPVSDLASLLSLEQVKPDAYLGAGPVLGWGRIYGGQVVAQALRAAGLTVGDHLQAQSLHAYFVRAGDEGQPVLYEVDRVRDSGSFGTSLGASTPSRTTSAGSAFPNRWATIR